MGQTRLLLLTLGVVIATIAIVIGIKLFQQGRVNANFDSLLRNSIDIASSAQTWKSTPQVLGGSADELKEDPTDYSAANFVAIGYSVEDFPRCYANENGLFAITPTFEGLRVTGLNLANQNRVVVLLRGTGDKRVIVQDGPLTSQKAVKGGHFLDSQAPTRVFRPLECSGRIAASSRRR